MTGRGFVGCSACVYLLAGCSVGPIPDVPRARMSVATPRGIRELCRKHAAFFLAPTTEPMGVTTGHEANAL